MKKTRRRILAVILAAVMAFTSPGTASYAVAEHGTAAEDSLKGGNVTSPEADRSTAGEAGTETDGSTAGEAGTVLVSPQCFPSIWERKMPGLPPACITTTGVQGNWNLLVRIK